MILSKPTEKVKAPDGFGDLAVVSCFFNWCGYKAPTRNLNRFIRQLKTAKVPLFGIELSLTNNFETAGLAGWLHIKVTNKNICFQKEALINLCVKKIVPKRFTKIAWLDSDVYFDTEDWHKRLSIALDYVKVVQPFRKCFWTNEKGECFKEAPSFLLEPIHNGEWKGHPGFAMATRRDFFDNGPKLFPYCAIGNGDTAFACGIDGDEESIHKYAIRGITEDKDSNNKFYQWLRAVKAYVGDSYNVIDGICYHEHHGSINNRNYWQRYEKYVKGFNFETDVFLNNLEILEFTDNFSQERRKKILQYFIDRKEDE